MELMRFPEAVTIPIDWAKPRYYWAQPFKLPE
jgi:hypothetical protein